MTIRALLVVLLMAGVARFGLLAWDGYCNGRVKGAAPWGPYSDREAQPVLYWFTIGVHLLVVVGFTGLAATIILGVVSPSN
jgi:hypothetical protein